MRESEFSFVPPEAERPTEQATVSSRPKGRFLKRLGTALALGGAFTAGIHEGRTDVASVREQYFKEHGMSDTEYKAFHELENFFSPPDGAYYSLTLENDETRQAFVIAETLQYSEAEEGLDRVNLLLTQLTQYPSEVVARTALQSLLNREKFFAGQRTRETVQKGEQVKIGHDQEVTDTLVSLIDQQYDLTLPDSGDTSRTPGTVLKYREKYPDGFGEVNRMALQALANRGVHGKRGLEDYIKTKQTRVEQVEKLLQTMK